MLSIRLRVCRLTLPPGSMDAEPVFPALRSPMHVTFGILNSGSYILCLQLEASMLVLEAVAHHSRYVYDKFPVTLLVVLQVWLGGFKPYSEAAM